MPRIIISTVGTSILANSIEAKHKSELFKHANAKKNQHPVKLAGLIEVLKEQVQNALNEMPVDGVRKLSAELNGVLGFYDSSLEAREDIHFLICTATYQGEISGEIVKHYLQKVRAFNNVQIFTPEKLSTENKTHFLAGIRDLLRWCDETLKGYKESGYEVVFNLTGSFKSLQGYLSTIGMFYADEIIYIFESGNEIIEIPRLPIQINEELFQQNASLFLLLSQDHFYSRKELEKIPDPMLFEVGADAWGLSPWGELSWNNVKYSILKEKLFLLPYLKFEDSFKKDFDRFEDAQVKVKLQETMAKISNLLMESRGDIAVLKGGRAGGILYSNYSGKNSHIGHFRLNDHDRVSCEFLSKELHLRHFGRHDDVNDNP